MTTLCYQNRLFLGSKPGYEQFRLYSGSKDLTIRVWNIACCGAVAQEQLVEPNHAQHALLGHKDAITCIVAVQSHLFLSASKDGTLILWSSDSLKPLFKRESLLDSPKEKRLDKEAAYVRELIWCEQS